jgi:hypothetical protein
VQQAFGVIVCWYARFGRCALHTLLSILKRSSILQSSQRETVVYKNKTWKGLAHQRYERDLKIRQKEGWQLVSCTESGRTFGGQVILTAIYERGAVALQPSLSIPNLPTLLSILSAEERGSFESEVAAVVNRWIATKARQ